MNFLSLKKHFRRGRKAVSPVVATLILIIVAIVGAVAVGLIVSGISSNTSKNANVNSVATQAQDVILVGGSTTVYPVTAAAVPTFESTSGIQVVLSQGGSDAGMQGILAGTLDVGESSSINAVNKLISEVSTEGITTITPVATMIGGSGVVFGTTSMCTPASFNSKTYISPCNVGSKLGANPLYDGANSCLEITRDALTVMYSVGTFYILPGACAVSQLDAPGVQTVATIAANANAATAAPLPVDVASVGSLTTGAVTDTVAFTYDNTTVADAPTAVTNVAPGIITVTSTVTQAVIPAGAIATITQTTPALTVVTTVTTTVGGAVSTTLTGPFQASHRTDAGGTQDTACGYLAGDTNPYAVKISYTSGQEGCGGSTLQGVGNLGVLQSVQGCPTADKGCIGFFDLGFADGASQQASTTCTQAGGSYPCNVFITEVSSSNGVNGEAALDPLLEATASAASSASSFAFGPGSGLTTTTGDSIGNIHTFIKSALKYGGLENPATLQFPTTLPAGVAVTFFPDASATAAGSQGALDRLLFLVVNGQTESPQVAKFVTFMDNPAAEPYFVGAGYDSQYDFSSV